MHIQDGQTGHIGSWLGTVEGPLRPMLSAERVMLNFLQRLSGIATTTNKFVQAIRGTKARIYDTRKTLPGWRLLEKYAVRCGGGYNHRLGLYDGILIKDNHLAELGRLFQPRLRKIVDEARKLKGVKFVAVEVDHVDDQLNHVLEVPGHRHRAAGQHGPVAVAARGGDAGPHVRQGQQAPARGLGQHQPEQRRGRGQIAAWTASPSARSPTRPGSWTSAWIGEHKVECGLRICGLRISRRWLYFEFESAI